LEKIKLFLFNTIIIVIGSIVLRVIGIYFGVYVSNRIGTELVGVFGLVMSVYMFGITLATSGINLASTRVISEELALGNTHNINKVTKKCIYISLISGIVTSFIFYINCDFIVSKCLHNRIDKTVIYVLCLALPLISMSSAINGYFSALRKMYKNVISQFVEQITRVFVSAFLLSLFLPKSINYACFSLILGDLISEIASFLYIYILYVLDAKKNISLPGGTVLVADVSPLAGLSLEKRIFRISIPVAITSYLRSGLNTLKQIIIPSSLEKSGLNCADSFSKYGIINIMCMPIITFPDVLIRSFSNLLIPEFSRYHVKKDYKSIRKFTLLLLFITSLLSILIALFLYVFSDNLALMLYKDSSIGLYIKILALIAPFIYIDSIVDNILRGLDAQVGVMVINIIDLIFTLSFIYFAVPLLGIKGYIYSIFISELLNFFISMFQLIKVVYLK